MNTVIKKSLFTLLVAGTCTGVFAADDIQLEKKRFFGRMGERVEAPENTLRAYRFAIDNGFPIEVDLWLTQDGELVAVNDENLKAKAGINKHPTNCCWKGELENVDMGAWKRGSWMGHWKNAGIRMPRIGEIFALLPKGSQNRFHLRDPRPEAARALRKALDSQSVIREEDLVFLTSRPHEKKLFPKAKFIIESEVDSDRKLMAKIRGVGAHGVSLPWNGGVVDARTIETLHRSGFSVDIRVDNDPKAALEAFRRGADSVTGDSVAYLFASASGYAAASKLNFSEKNIVAHRGESELEPENTLPAYIAAAKNGFALEIDLYMTLDGVVYCTHDLRSWRKNSGLPAYEWSTNLYWKGQLENADAGAWMGEKWKGVKYPRFEEVLPIVRKYGVWVIVEIKDPRKNLIMPEVERIIAAAEGLGPDNVILAGAGEHMRGYRVTATCLLRKGWLADDLPLNTSYVKKLDPKRIAMFAPRWDNLLLTEELVKTAHSRGIKVAVWTVNDAGIALEALRRGVDYVLSDRPINLYREMQKAKKR